MEVNTLIRQVDVVSAADRDLIAVFIRDSRVHCAAFYSTNEPNVPADKIRTRNDCVNIVNGLICVKYDGKVHNMYRQGKTQDSQLGPNKASSIT